MKKTIYIIWVAIIFLHCNTNNNSSQDQDFQNLQSILNEIENIITKVPCTDPADWTFTSYGSKACGGPIGYLAYPTTIDVNNLLEKIKAHKDAQEAYNKKWGIISDCSLPATPTGVICENNKAVLTY